MFALTPSRAPIARVEQDTFLSEHGGEAAADFFKNVLLGQHRRLDVDVGIIIRCASKLTFGRVDQDTFLSQRGDVSSTVY